MIFSSDKVYDRLKFVAQVILPGLATLYLALSELWGLPYGPQIVGTITDLDTFLGALLGVSGKQYQESDARFDGALNIYEDDVTKTFQLELFDDPEYQVANKEALTFRVNKDVRQVAS